VLLYAGGAQPEKPIVLERALPSEELLFRHLITATRLIERDYAAGYRCHDHGFAASYPPTGVLGRQLDHRLEFICIIKATGVSYSPRIIIGVLSRNDRAARGLRQ
jgi:hypothetical protein